MGGLNLEFYIRTWIFIDWGLFGFQACYSFKLLFAPSLAPNWPGVIVYLQTICVGRHMMVALMKYTPKGSCSHSRIFPPDSISVLYNLVSRS